jgi:hypothetical protein
MSKCLTVVALVLLVLTGAMGLRNIVAAGATAAPSWAIGPGPPPQASAIWAIGPGAPPQASAIWASAQARHRPGSQCVIPSGRLGSRGGSAFRC